MGAVDGCSRTSVAPTCEVRPRKDERGVDLIPHAPPFGGLWYGDTDAVANAIGYAEQYSRSHHAVIRVYDDAGNVIETHQHKGELSRAVTRFAPLPSGYSLRTYLILLIDV